VSIDIDAITLAKGSHRTPDEGMCLMEAVAYVAGESHSDRPECVCPVLAAFGRTWNDALDDEDRNRLLKPFIPLLVGTRSTPAVEQRRGFLAADWVVRVYAPVWLRAAGLEDEAAELEGLAPLLSVESSVAARPAIDRARAAAMDAAAAALAAAGDAAIDAAVAVATAAWDAAAAIYAAEDAAAYAGTAVWHPAWDAATDAATAVAATGGALRPHVEQLQASAADLYRRMIEVTE